MLLGSLLRQLCRTVAKQEAAGNSCRSGLDTPDFSARWRRAARLLPNRLHSMVWHNLGGSRKPESLKQEFLFFSVQTRPPLNFILQSVSVNVSLPKIKTAKQCTEPRNLQKKTTTLPRCPSAPPDPPTKGTRDAQESEWTRKKERPKLAAGRANRANEKTAKGWAYTIDKAGNRLGAH